MPRGFQKIPLLCTPIKGVEQTENITGAVHESGQEAFHALPHKVLEGVPEEAQEIYQEAENTGEYAARASRAWGGASATRGSAAVC